MLGAKYHSRMKESEKPSPFTNTTHCIISSLVWAQQKNPLASHCHNFLFIELHLGIMVNFLSPTVTQIQTLLENAQKLPDLKFWLLKHAQIVIFWPKLVAWSAFELQACSNPIPHTIGRPFDLVQKTAIVTFFHNTFFSFTILLVTIYTIHLCGRSVVSFWLQYNEQLKLLQKCMHLISLHSCTILQRK